MQIRFSGQRGADKEGPGLYELSVREQFVVVAFLCLFYLVAQHFIVPHVASSTTDSLHATSETAVTADRM